MNPTRFRLRLRDAGMFSNVNEVVQQLYLANKAHYQFEIDWRRSCYLESEIGENPWNYYFEDCFNSTDWAKDLPLLATGKSIACSKENVITPRLKDGQCAPLLLPTNRQLPARLIAHYIKPNQKSLELIQLGSMSFKDTYVIGLHIRGLGRNHGGAASLRQIGQKQFEMDYHRYFSAVDLQLKTHPNAKIFVCSDSQTVIDQVNQTYGERVISYPSARSAFGEMHADHAKNAGLIFSPFKLGQDVMVEAHLLAMTDYFVHGNSNVANFVLCKNPNLGSTYVYETEMQNAILKQHSR